MKTSPLDFKDYRSYLKSVIKEAQPSRGIISRLADAAGCQRAYLSRALSSEVQLTLDHIYGIAKFLYLNELETDYLVTLTNLERANSVDYKNYLKDHLRKLQQQHDDLQKRVQRPNLTDENKNLIYYSNWLYSAMHIIVSIPKFQTTKEISNRLNIPQELALSILNQLKEMKLIKNQNSKWEFANSELHINKNSPLSVFHHQNWRQRAVIDMQSMNPESIHFTVVQSIDKDAWSKIKNKIIEFIEEASQIARPSKEEKLICLTTDFFEI